MSGATHIVQGRRFGPYVLDRRIGQGGMGDVWSATHDRLRRPAVVKLIRPDRLADSPQSQHVVSRFEREAAATATLTSPHVVRLYDYGVDDDGVCYQVMELLDGCTLGELAARTGPMPVARAIHLLLQACEALGEAHQLEMVHRDIKPANLFVCMVGLRRDFVKVLDFGLVRQPDDVELTAANVVAGTPGYMAPESLLKRDAVDARFDVYALGCVAYLLTAGRRVFEGETSYEIIDRHIHATPARLDDLVGAATDFADVVARCLAKSPVDRPADAREMGRLLAACTDAGDWSDEAAETWWVGAPTAAAPPEPPAEPPEPPSRRRWSASTSPRFRRWSCCRSRASPRLQTTISSPKGSPRISSSSSPRSETCS